MTQKELDRLAAQKEHEIAPAQNRPYETTAILEVAHQQIDWLEYEILEFLTGRDES